MKNMNDRDINIILAALSNLHGDLAANKPMSNLSEIVDVENVSLDEINELCERLNLGEDDSAKKTIEYLNSLNVTEALWWFMENIDHEHKDRTEITSVRLKTQTNSTGYRFH